MADITTDGMDAEQAASLGRRYLIRFEEDTLRQRPLWIRLIIELLGTFVLVTVAAGSGVINHYVGGGPISRTAAVIAPRGGGHGHDLRVGPVVGTAHQPGRDLRLQRPRGVSRQMGGAVLGGAVRRGHSPGPSVPACSCRSCSVT